MGVGALLLAGMLGVGVARADEIAPPFPGAVVNGRIFLPLSTGAEAPIIANTAVHTQVIGGTTGYILMDGFDSTNQLRFRRAGGTPASPTLLINGQSIGRVTFSGYDGSAWTNPAAAMFGFSANNWSTTDHAAHLTFQTTNVGSTTLTDAARIQPDQSLSVGGSTWDPAGTGVNKLYVMGHVNITTGSVYKVNNVQVLGARDTGWTAPTGTPQKTGFATSTATTTQLAQTMKSVIDALITHGILGP
jgi:hypothetical protein